MGIGMMTRFAWFPCTWVSEFGTSAKPMDEFWRLCRVLETGMKWV